LKKNKTLKKDGLYYSYVSVVRKKSRPILFSRYFIIFTILFISSFTTMAALIPAWGGLSIHGGWTFGLTLMFSATFVAAITGVMGDLYMDRASKASLIFYFIYIIIYFIQCYFWALYYEMFQQIITFILVVISTMNWGRKKATKKETEIKFMDINSYGIIMVTAFLISIGLGIIMKFSINPWINNHYIVNANGTVDKNLTPWWAQRGVDPLPFLDSFVLVMFLTAWGFFTKRYVNAYWTMFACIMGYFLVYGYMAFGQGIPNYISYFIVNFFYLFLNQSGMSNWSMMYFEQEEAKKKITANLN